MNDVIKIAHLIKSKVELLERMRGEIRDRAETKALAISEYDKALSITILKEKENGTPVSIIDKVSKGKIYEKRYELELADGLYKSLISNINSIQAELNGLQSINRHLSEL